MRIIAIAVLILTAFILIPNTAVAQVPEVAQFNAETASVPQLEARADALRLNKGYTEAAGLYRISLKKEPKSAVLWNKLGIATLQANDYTTARGYFKKAIKFNKQYPEAYNNIAVTYYMQKHYRTAVKEYRKAIQLRETQASFHANLGSAYFAQKKMEPAMASYTRAMELDPDVLIRTAMGGITAQVSSPEDRAKYNYLIAKMYAKRGDVERCLHCLKKAKEDGFKDLAKFHEDPEFAVVRTDPRFTELVPVKAH